MHCEHLYSTPTAKLFSRDTQRNDVVCIDLFTAALLENDPTEFQSILSRNIQNINRQNRSGWTSLMYACQSGNATAVELLLRYEANERILNSKGQTAFMVASVFGHEDILQLLSITHLYLNSIDTKGWCSLMYATALGHVETAKFLIQKGANVNFVDRNNGQSILMVVAADMELCNVLLPLLIGRGADYTLLSSDLKSAADVVNGHGKEYEEVANYLRNPFQHHTHDSLPKSLLAFLKLNKLEEYIQLFEEKKVDLEKFVTFTEQDLKIIGIRLLGPRKKMAHAIEKYIYEKAMNAYGLRK